MRQRLKGGEQNGAQAGAYVDGYSNGGMSEGTRGINTDGDTTHIMKNSPGRVENQQQQQM